MGVDVDHSVVAERDAARQELEEARATLADLQAKELDVEADSAIKSLLEDGRIRPGGKQEQLLRARFASGDADGARALVAAFTENPRVAPVGPRQSATDVPTAPPADGAIDYKAAFAALPVHLREAAAAYADNPKRLFELRPELLKKIQA